MSYLRYMDSGQRVRLAQALEQVSAESLGLHDWEDTLAYLAMAPPAFSVETGKARLISALSQSA